MTIGELVLYGIAVWFGVAIFVGIFSAVILGIQIWWNE